MRETFGFNRDELRILRSLSTPQKIQDFLEELPMHFRDTYLSPRMVLRMRTAQCMEGAMFAAAALRLQGRRPLVLDLATAEGDDDHVVALFRERGHWGAISKTNHAVLRYRDPIYRTIRELALSYFHEYFLDGGRKTLRSYAGPINLARFDGRGWMTAEGPVPYIPAYLFRARHTLLLSPRQAYLLRPADPVERRAGRITAWKGGKRVA